MPMRRVSVPSPKRQRVLPNGHPMGSLPIEKEYQRALLVRMCVELPHLQWEGRNTGVMLLDNANGSRRAFRAARKGQADVYGFGPRYHVEIEIKRFTKLTPEQEAWRDQMLRRGVPWLLLEVRKTEQPAETVERWVREVSQFVGASR